MHKVQKNKYYLTKTEILPLIIHYQIILFT